VAMRADGMDSASPAHRVMRKLLARTRLQLRASCATGPAAFCLPALWPACCHCPATPATPHTIMLRPALPGPCPSRCAVYKAPLSPMLARPARPVSPAKCVLCSVLSLRWLVCSFGYDQVSSQLPVGCFQLLLSSVARRLLPCVTTRRPAVNAHSPGCRVVALVVCCAMRSVCEGRLAGSRLQLLCCGRSFRVRTLHTHHIHTTPQPLITHNHLHPSHYHRLALAHASLRWHSVPVDALCA
jgi:hypothetical protein